MIYLIYFIIYIQLLILKYIILHIGVFNKFLLKYLVKNVKIYETRQKYKLL